MPSYTYIKRPRLTSALLFWAMFVAPVIFMAMIAVKNIGNPNASGLLDTRVVQLEQWQISAIAAFYIAGGFFGRPSGRGLRVRTDANGSRLETGLFRWKPIGGYMAEPYHYAYAIRLHEPESDIHVGVFVLAVTPVDTITADVLIAILRQPTIETWAYICSAQIDESFDSIPLPQSDISRQTLTVTKADMNTLDKLS